ncbi:ion channel [Penicillium canescens]|nr:ion channel [Penicillium canescens]
MTLLALQLVFLKHLNAHERASDGAQNTFDGRQQRGLILNEVTGLLPLQYPSLLRLLAPLPTNFLEGGSASTAKEYLRSSVLFKDRVPNNFLNEIRCLGLNAASLACGVIGNIFLLLDFTRCVAYITALPASIILWFLATGFLTGSTITLNVHGAPISPGQRYSQGYWYAVIAAVLYCFLAMILIVNMFGYFCHHYLGDFVLSEPQRTLILQTMLFYAWLIVSAAVFQKVLDDVDFDDAIYFSEVTVLTVGFGDIYPRKHNSARGLVILFAAVGIVILVLVVTSFMEELSSAKLVKGHGKRQRATARKQDLTLPDKPNQDPEFQHLRMCHDDRESGRRQSICSAAPAISRATAAGQSTLFLRQDGKVRVDTPRSIQQPNGQKKMD